MLNLKIMVLPFFLFFLFSCSSSKPGEQFIGVWGSECNFELEIKRNGESFIVNTENNERFPASYDKGLLRTFVARRGKSKEFIYGYDETNGVLIDPRGLTLKRLSSDTPDDYIGTWISIPSEGREKSINVEIAKKDDLFKLKVVSPEKGDDINIKYDNGIFFIPDLGGEYLIYDKKNDQICLQGATFKRKK
jgi:hypothetical protein